MMRDSSIWPISRCQPGRRWSRSSALFPRIDAKPGIDKMKELEDEETRRQARAVREGEESPKEESIGLTVSAESQPRAPAPSDVAPLEPEITIDDFVKVDLRVGW